MTHCLWSNTSPGKEKKQTQVVSGIESSKRKKKGKEKMKKKYVLHPLERAIGKRDDDELLRLVWCHKAATPVVSEQLKAKMTTILWGPWHCHRNRHHNLNGSTAENEKKSWKKAVHEWKKMRNTQPITPTEKKTRPPCNANKNPKEERSAKKRWVNMPQIRQCNASVVIRRVRRVWRGLSAREEIKTTAVWREE